MSPAQDNSKQHIEVNKGFILESTAAYEVIIYTIFILLQDHTSIFFILLPDGSERETW